MSRAFSTGDLEALRPARRRMPAPWSASATATTPRSVAARWNGPHGPGIVVRMTALSGIARVSHRPADGILPGSMTTRKADHRADPAHRGHDLRVLRQPDRALPAARRRVSRRRRSTWPPRRRRSATSPTSPIGRLSSAPSRPPATTSERGRRRGRRRSAARLPTSCAADDLERARDARGAARPGAGLDRGRRSGSWS